MSNRVRKSKYDQIMRLNEGLLNENVPLTSKCPSGCYCNGSDCVKMVITSGGGTSNKPTTKSCGKKCTKNNPNLTQEPTTDRRRTKSSSMIPKCFKVDAGGCLECPSEECNKSTTPCIYPTKQNCEEDNGFVGPLYTENLKEDCGCGESKETSEDSYMAASQLHSISNKSEDMYNKLEKDEVLDDWVESHLAKIDQMMDSVSDSFNHDQYKHVGDMEVDVVSLNEQEIPGMVRADSEATNDIEDTKEPVKKIKPSEDKEVDVKTLIKKYEPQGKKTEPPTHPSVILGDSEGVIKEQVAGCTASTNPNARKVYFWWVNAGIMPPGPNGIWPGCPPPCNQLPACQPPVGCNWSYGQPMPITAGNPPSCIWQGTWLKAVTVNGQAPQPGDIIDWTTGIKQCSGTALNLSNTTGNLIGVYAAVQPNYPTAEVIDFGGGAPPTTGCDQSAWPNYSNWVSTFTSLPNFSSSNPNQPCQMLCQKETQFGNALSTGMVNGQQMGPLWTNQIQCKYDEIQTLMNTHNCASSNAPAC